MYVCEETCEETKTVYKISSRSGTSHRPTGSSLKSITAKTLPEDFFI